MPSLNPSYKPSFTDLSELDLREQIELAYAEFVSMVQGPFSDEGLEEVRVLDPEKTVGIQSTSGEYTLCYALETRESGKKRYVPVEFVQNQQEVWEKFKPALQLIDHYAKMTSQP